MCGRIAPEQVFDYLKKLRHSSRTEITVMKLVPGNSTEKVGYEQFFGYLNQRKRFGVVGNSGKQVKDFYILPLAKDASPPELLSSMDGFELEKRHHRTNLLLGILVRTRKHPERSGSGDRPAEERPSSSHGSRSGSLSERVRDPERSYTPPPPSSRKRVKSSASIEEVDEQVSYTPPRREATPDETCILLEDEEEPYDPEESSSVFERLTTLKEKTKILPDEAGSSLPVHSDDGVSSSVLGQIETAGTIEQQRQLLDDLVNRVEQSRRQLELQRKAAENAFNIATGSGFALDSNTIPGLDGDFSAVNEPSTPSTGKLNISNSTLDQLLSNIKEAQARAKAKAKASEYPHSVQRILKRF